MHLRSLEIQGFKSFPDKTRLEFGRGLTVVVGPNGSGKSNISDAVRWVLGEQSTKSLRGSKMEDVIFSGTKTRKAQGMAQVSLTIDNASRTLPVEADEVTVTRRLYRSGESEYRLNGAAVRLKDIYEIFMDTGLGRDGYSIIGQGRIAEIVSARDKERREIFEEAAGISKFRYRKGEAEKRLALAQDNLSRLADILSELEGRVEPLRRQSEKARKFLELSGQKKRLELSLWMDDLEESRKNLSGQSDKIQLMRRQYNQLEAQVGALEQQIGDLYQQMQSCSARVDRCRVQIHEREQKIAANQSEMAVCSNDMDHAREDIRRLEEEIQAAELTGGLVEKRLEHLETLLEQDNAQIAENHTTVEAITKTLEKLRGQEQESSTLAGKLAMQRQQMLGEQSQAQADAITAASLIAQANTHLEQLTGQLKECEDNAVRLEKESGQFDALEQAAREQQQALNNVLQGVELKRTSREQALQKQQQREQQLRREMEGFLQRASLLEGMEQNHEGFQNSVRFLLKQAKSGAIQGIRGSVSDLLTVRSDYALAIETVLGASIQNVVVEDEEAAKRAITSPLLEDITIGGAKAMLVNITASEDMGMDEFSNAGAYIRDAARGPNGEDPEIIVAMSVDETCGDEMRITVIATGIEAPVAAVKVTTLTTGGKPQPEAAPAPQAESRSFRPATRPGVVPPEVRHQSSLFRGFDDEDRTIPAYLRVKERLQQAGRHAPGADDFTFEDESDVPSFIRRQAN